MKMSDSAYAGKWNEFSTKSVATVGRLSVIYRQSVKNIQNEMLTVFCAPIFIGCVHGSNLGSTHVFVTCINCWYILCFVASAWIYYKKKKQAHRKSGISMKTNLFEVSINIHKVILFYVILQCSKFCCIFLFFQFKC